MQDPLSPAIHARSSPCRAVAVVGGGGPSDPAPFPAFPPLVAPTSLANCFSPWVGFHQWAVLGHHGSHLGELQTAKWSDSKHAKTSGVSRWAQFAVRAFTLGTTTTGRPPPFSSRLAAIPVVENRGGTYIACHYCCTPSPPPISLRLAAIPTAENRGGHMLPIYRHCIPLGFLT